VIFTHRPKQSLHAGDEIAGTLTSDWKRACAKCMRTAVAVLLALLAGAAVSAESSQPYAASGTTLHESNIRLTPLLHVPVSAELDAPASRATVVYSGDHVYLALPEAVLQGSAPLTPATQLRPVFRLPSRTINRIYAYDGVLYVLTNAAGNNRDPLLFKSVDDGQSFVAADAGLKECFEDECTYLESTELLDRAGLLYVNAGGGRNLAVSADRGATFQPLSGEMTSVPCYFGTFAIFGKTALLGGECGLDMPYLERGVLSADGLRVVEDFAPAQTPPLSNRKINVIANDPGTPNVLAGAEGALLRSTDEGRHFELAIRYESDGGFYPYIEHVLFPASRPDLVLVAGFDKAGFAPYLAYADRDGLHWTDISHVLSTSADAVVTGLTEDPRGRLLVTTASQADRLISVYQLEVSPPGAAEAQTP